jgi:FixJ family two-component response regulator
MGLVVQGLLNKQIATDLGTSETTVKIHRGQVMRKMQADSLPDLVRMAERLSLPAQKY